MTENCAVCVKNVYKSYESNIVLNNLNMHVPRGIIYGLLGASGCGKTTLLNCIVGSQHLDSGQIFILKSNNSNCSQNSNIGYMPQEVALAKEFTIKEAIYYFGVIYEVSKSLIEERFQKLSRLLDLPSDKKLLKHCSGGEQRRISFAVALVNNPKVLILDEPTVGLDPILREMLEVLHKVFFLLLFEYGKISFPALVRKTNAYFGFYSNKSKNNLWNYLLKIVETHESAVIITTHYIEEAIRAHRVGFMRQGKLLAEDSPKNFLALHKTDTLENVFLILSSNQNKFSTSNNNNEQFFKLPEKYTTDVSKMKTSNCSSIHRKLLRELSLNPNRLMALLTKNRIQFSRNISGIFITFLLPIIALLVMLTAIGNNIKSIDIAIVNEEFTINFCNSHKLETTLTGREKCKIKNLSCKFIRDLENPSIYMMFFENIADALNALKHGKVLGVLHIPTNFSHSFQQRIETPFDISNEILSGGQISAWIDVSNKQIALYLKQELSQKVVKLQRNIVKNCNYTPIDSIVQLKNVYYGNSDDKFRSFLIPGMLLTVTFFMSVTNTVDTIISDKLEGTWHRSSVAGVSCLEIILTHFLTQFLIVIIQIVEIVILTFFVYKTEYEGNLIEIVIILLAGSVCGMSYGFWISVICNTHSVANFLTTGSFYPLVLISGVLWPLEGMPKVLQYFAFSLPIALPTLSVRNIMKKGWNLTNFGVLNGLGVQILWILLLAIFCICRFRK